MHHWIFIPVRLAAVSSGLKRLRSADVTNLKRDFTGKHIREGIVCEHVDIADKSEHGDIACGPSPVHIHTSNREPLGREREHGGFAYGVSLAYIPLPSSL